MLGVAERIQPDALPSAQHGKAMVSANQEVNFPQKLIKEIKALLIKNSVVFPSLKAVFEHLLYGRHCSRSKCTSEEDT